MAWRDRDRDLGSAGAGSCASLAPRAGRVKLRLSAA
jgi:hypothetical protein